MSEADRYVSAFNPPLGQVEIFIGDGLRHCLTVYPVHHQTTRSDLDQAIDKHSSTGSKSMYVTVVDIVHTVNVNLRSRLKIDQWRRSSRGEKWVWIEGMAIREGFGVIPPFDLGSFPERDVTDRIDPQLSKFRVSDVLGRNVMFAGLVPTDVPQKWRMITKEP